MNITTGLHPYEGRGLRLLLVILIVSLNLRGAITCVGPLLQLIQEEHGLSGTAAGLLTSLPLFAFGFISPYAAPLARRLGIEKAVFYASLTLVAGLALRYVSGPLPLYLGTGLIGIGIAINNVLLPGLLRRDFPLQIASVTAVFTMVMVTVGGLGSGITVPLAEWGGWRFSLVTWLFPALLGVLVWLPRLKENTLPRPGPDAGKTSLWHNGLAWQVSLFMACQSTAFYVLIAWLPSMLLEMEGISLARSGWILFVYQIFVLGSVMLIPWLVKRLPDQRWIGSGCASLILIAYAGLLLDTQNAMGWMIVMGLGAGGSLVLAITLFGLRTSSASETVALSGMAQAIGYMLAAIMPILLGALHDLLQQWHLPLAIMVGLAFIQVCTGYLAGRPLTVSESQELKPRS